MNKKEEAEEHAHYHGVDRAEKQVSVEKVLREFLSRIEPLGSELISVSSSSSLHRIIFKDVRSAIDIPSRSRSTRDGFAVRLERKQSMAPIGSTFKIVGDVRIGVVPKLSLKAGEAARVATGSTIPHGTNAVLMKEYAKLLDDDRGGALLSSERPIKLLQNILSEGEDIRKNSVIMKKGLEIRPQHIALLSQLDVREISVFKRPRVSFFSTGDELIDTKRKKSKAGLEHDDASSKIYDSNRPFLESEILELGALPMDLGIARDDYKQMKSKVIKGLKNSDALFISAGSSVGERDFVSRAVESIDGVRILAHGVAMRPSSPTGLATMRGKPIVLLPGFPTSAIVSFFVFGRPAILKLAGSSSTSQLYISAKMLEKYEGKIGLTHFIRVKVKRDPKRRYLATIVRPTESSYSSWMREANGIAVIDEKSSPLEPGQEVAVFPIGAI